MLSFVNYLVFNVTQEYFGTTRLRFVTLSSVWVSLKLIKLKVLRNWLEQLCFAVSFVKLFTQGCSIRIELSNLQQSGIRCGVKINTILRKNITYAHTRSQNHNYIYTWDLVFYACPIILCFFPLVTNLDKWTGLNISVRHGKCVHVASLFAWELVQVVAPPARLRYMNTDYINLVGWNGYSFLN